MLKQFATTSITELVASFGTRETSPVEAIEAALEQHEYVNGRINAVFNVDADRVLEEAREARNRWISGKPLSGLDGVPITVKPAFPR